MFYHLNTNLFYLINLQTGKNIFIDNLGIFFAEYLPYFFILTLFILWFSKKKYKTRTLLSVYSAILGIILDFIISIFYFHPRPFMDNVGTSLIKHLSGASFPSDHTTFMLSIAFLFLYFKETRFVGIILSILGLLGGVSRIFVGVHYPFDILGSIIVSVIISYFIFRYRNKFDKLNNFFINLYNKIRIIIFNK